MTRLQEGLTKRDVDVKVKKSNITVPKKVIETSQAKQIKQDKVVPEVPKVERVFANDKERSLYEKKVARRLRWKKNVRQRKLNVRKSNSSDVELENIEENCLITAPKKIIETSQAKQVKQDKVVSSVVQVVPKVERVFANDKERYLYEKKVARRLRQKEKIRQRKVILSTNDDNRLTEVIKEREEKRKEKRLEIASAKKAERERLEGLVAITVKNENGTTKVLTNAQKRKRRKSKKTCLSFESSAGNEKNQVEIEPMNDDFEETISKKKKRNDNSETATEEPISEEIEDISS